MIIDPEAEQLLQLAIHLMLARLLEELRVVLGKRRERVHEDELRLALLTLVAPVVVMISINFLKQTRQVLQEEPVQRCVVHVHVERNRLTLWTNLFELSQQLEHEHLVNFTGTIHGQLLVQSQAGLRNLAELLLLLDMAHFEESAGMLDVVQCFFVHSDEVLVGITLAQCLAVYLEFCAPLGQLFNTLNQLVLRELRSCNFCAEIKGQGIVTGGPQLQGRLWQLLPPRITCVIDKISQERHVLMWKLVLRTLESRSQFSLIWIMLHQ